MPFNLGLGEVLVILVVALLVFGGRLPQVGRSLGKGLVEFKKGLTGAPPPLADDNEAKTLPQPEEEEALLPKEDGEAREEGSTTPGPSP